MATFFADNNFSSNIFTLIPLINLAFYGNAC